MMYYRLIPTTSIRNESNMEKDCYIKLVSLRRFERLTFTFGGCHSVQLSYRDLPILFQPRIQGFFVNTFDADRVFSILTDLVGKEILHFLQFIRNVNMLWTLSQTSTTSCAVFRSVFLWYKPAIFLFVTLFISKHIGI